MIYRISEKDYTKERFIELLNEMLNTQLDFKNLYKNFGAVQVSVAHPFALLSMTPDADKKGIFPCVSVNIPEESEGEETLAYEQEDIEVTTAMIDTWLALKDEQRLISKERLNVIRAAIEATAGKSISAERWTKRIRQTLTCAVWAPHYAVRDSLYQACRSTFIQYRKALEDEGFTNYSISGASDLYNVEFGMMLFGAEVRAVGENYLVEYRLEDYDTIGETHIIVHPAN
jgi:hypothetical protein